MDLNGQPLRVVHTHELKVCEHNDIIHHVEYDFYSRRIALVSSDKIVSVYTKLPENKGWTKTGQFKVSGGATWRVRWAHPSFSQVLATASFDGSIFIFQETAKLNSPLETQNGQLISCDWKQRAYIPANPPCSVTDIRFVPHFFGLMLGSCDSRGYVTVYEAQNPLNLDCWLPQMKLSIFDYRCKSLAFSTNRFNTLLMATCTDDDRCRCDKQLAIFPFVRNCDIDNIPPPEIKYLSPSVGLDVIHLPPTDLQFSPTGALSFQRLAVAVGPYIVIYHISTVAKDKTLRPDSPMSTMSESSQGTVVMAPTISVTKPKSDVEEQVDDVLSLAALKLEAAAATRESIEKEVVAAHGKTKASYYHKAHANAVDKSNKKSVQFKIDPDATKDRAQSPVPKKPTVEPSPDLVIKPSLKKTKNTKIDTSTNQFKPEEIAKMKSMHPRKSYGSESMEVEASASDEVHTPSPVQEEMPSTPSSMPIDIAPNKSGVNKRSSDEEEDKAEEADSETSDAPGAIKKKSPAKERTEYIFDPRGIYAPFPPIGPEVARDPTAETMPSHRHKVNSIFGEDVFQSTASTASASAAVKKTANDAPGSPTQNKKGESPAGNKDKSKKQKRKRHQEEGDKNELDNFSSSSDDSSSKNKTIKKHLTKTEKPQGLIQKTTTEFRSDRDGRHESALIKVENFNSAGFIVPPDVVEDDDEHELTIITLRRAVLAAGKSQTRRISFNHTGSLITAVYADGRVRVWKRINPVLWVCASVIDPPKVKGKEDLSIMSEGAYY